VTGETFSGGCQCGAVRFRVEGPLGRASLCHCRMCQKASGGPFGAFVGGETTTWTRGRPAHFQSSARVRRGYCSACGTPLTFEFDNQTLELSIFAFDEPAKIEPAIQMRVGDRVAWMAHIEALPMRPDADAPWQAGIVSRQHPDHDTLTWPPADGRAE
jgi:hypothetical protein